MRQAVQSMELQAMDHVRLSSVQRIAPQSRIFIVLEVRRILVADYRW
jgi:hypothetical protein